MNAIQRPALRNESPIAKWSTRPFPFPPSLPLPFFVLSFPSKSLSRSYFQTSTRIKGKRTHALSREGINQNKMRYFYFFCPSRARQHSRLPFNDPSFSALLIGPNLLLSSSSSFLSPGRERERCSHGQFCRVGRHAPSRRIKTSVVLLHLPLPFPPLPLSLRGVAF